MPERIAEPTPIQYDGWDAAEQMMDAQKLGLSLQGLARLYRSTSHFYLTGATPQRLRNADVRVLAGPPQPGSISYVIWVMLAHGRLAMYPELLREFADICIPEFVKALIAKRGNQTKALEKAVDTIAEMAKDNAAITNRFMDFAERVHKADQLDKKRLHGLIERFAQKNSSALIDLVAPVGTTVRTLTHAKDKPAEMMIDEPTADTIRAQGTLAVLEPVQMVVRLMAVDMTNRTVKVLSTENKKPVRARIVDPALMQPQNPTRKHSTTKHPS